jgi:protein-S-isoprenylcysteine O-methyltransferase Ste14
MNSFEIFRLTSILVVLFVSTIVYLVEHFRRKYAAGKSRELPTSKKFSIAYHAIQFFLVISALDAATLKIGTLFENDSVHIAGLILMFIGLIVFVIAKRHLGKNYAPCFDAYVPFRIVNTGIYRWIRHPIYTANSLAVAGVFVATGHIFALFALVILVSFYVSSARVEEEVLAENFPEYRSYKALSYRFIPFVI